MERKNSKQQNILESYLGFCCCLVWFAFGFLFWFIFGYVVLLLLLLLLCFVFYKSQSYMVKGTAEILPFSQAWCLSILEASHSRSQ